MKLTRRQYLFGTSAAAVSLLAGGSLLVSFRDSLPRDLHDLGWANGISELPDDPTLWVEIRNDNTVVVTINKVEMGQGIATGLAALVAEEMDADWRDVRVELAPLGDSYLLGQKNQSTGANRSLRDLWIPMRHVGALMRELLVSAAAKGWGVPADECFTANGRVFHRSTGREYPYAELTDAISTGQLPDESPPLKRPENWKLIGRSLPRLNNDLVVRGEHLYAQDFEIDEMLVAQVVQAPCRGAKPADFDRSSALAVPGVRHVLSIDGEFPYVAVVADHYWAAEKGRRALDIHWRLPSGARVIDTSYLMDLMRQSVAGRGRVLEKWGDIGTALERAVKRVEVQYEIPYLCHAPMETPCAIAHVHDGRCEVWGNIQNLSRAARLAARGAGVRRRAVEINPLPLGGAFGRGLYPDAVMQAARLSRELGVPVKVIWTREDDIRHDRYHPATVSKVTVALDVAGGIAGYFHRVAAISPSPAAVERGLVEFDYSAKAALFEARALDAGDLGSGGGFEPATGAVRGVGRTHNVFCRECTLDECAAAVGQDPAEFRRKLITEPRLGRVLDIAMERAHWGPARNDLGLAVHCDGLSSAAAVAQVVVGAANMILVKRIVVVIDCGMVVNPDHVHAAVEGGVIFGLSAVLKGEVTVTAGLIDQSNFHDYAILGMREAPEIAVHIVTADPDEPPGPIGDIAQVITGPAVCNAIARQTGYRAKSLPLNSAGRPGTGPVPA